MTRNVRIMDCTLEMLVRCQKEEAKRMSAHRINNIKRIQTDRVSLYHVLFILIRHCVCLHIAVYQIGSQQRRRSDEHEYTYINTCNVHRAFGCGGRRFREKPYDNALYAVRQTEQGRKTTPMPNGIHTHICHIVRYDSERCVSSRLGFSVVVVVVVERVAVAYANTKGKLTNSVSPCSRATNLLIYGTKL